jgi:acyl-CoA synthetase (AMP-forming)/AMP-acid ligase II
MSAPSLKPSAFQTAQPVNVAERLSDIARRFPETVAVATPGSGDVAGKNCYTTCTFAELERDATALARGLVELGVKRGMRLVLLVQPGVEFVKLTLALLRSGATTVLIDPGMGRSHLLRCLAATQPEGFVAISRAQAVRTILHQRFPQTRINVTVGRRWFWGGPTYKKLLERGQQSRATLPITCSSDPAAIIFTSGSTGPPKGVLYTHQMFDTQAVEIRRQYDIHPGSTDLACFPLFGLFNSVMGVTTVFPDMDFARPASADPTKLLAAANDWQITQAFASPAVWRKLSRHCTEAGEMIATLRKVFSCGAPVPADVLRRTLSVVAAGATMHTPYGATESLPIATIEAAEVLEETAALTDQGAGFCVGKKFNSVEWRIIRITDASLESIDQVEELPRGEIGELIVRGPQVSPEYVIGTDHNAQAKIADGDSNWHRLGDVGYFDAGQRFWYCGRKAHRVITLEKTLYTIPCEAIFNAHSEVTRSALVGVGRRGNASPVLVVEPHINGPTDHLEEELWQLAGKHPHTATIQQILFHKSLPVDVRHNSKINRELLAKWASQQLQNP